MTDRRAIADHLKHFSDLGVKGLSKDPAWRERADVGATSVGAADVGAGFSPPVVGPAEAGPYVQSGSEEVLSDLRNNIGPACTLCKLGSQGRKQVVFGSGSPTADLMFIGEAPGADEDQQGEPFVGRAGQLLTKIIEAINLTRDQVYIANVIKCRPPGNRPPEQDEIATCEPFLFKQIDAIRPKVIVALGTHAAHALLKVDTPISRLRGRVHEFRDGIKLVPTFHPAFLLRSPDRKRDVWEDMKKVRALLNNEPVD